MKGLPWAMLSLSQTPLPFYYYIKTLPARLSGTLILVLMQDIASQNFDSNKTISTSTKSDPGFSAA
ncbi:hypothetical protein F511_07694 [Dorcoceras hygrometricum]|uniref:Uncharacterized protein n=1 Tax=Dorcoceras hygrometricum TaxID=472368 RepID=A0A2Z7CJJ8_9LAMI|nr:hypothetical protein F511_07694 [Dorcoceras hygrometricum]